MEEPWDPPKLVLASASPRRRDLLAQAGFAAQVLPSSWHECPLPDEKPTEYCQRNAREKALDVARHQPLSCAGAWVLGADTIVVSPQGKILEKPTDRAHALAMLEELSGKTHQVLTGVAFVDGTALQAAQVFVVSTQVLFRSLSLWEREHYVDSGEPFDKAGGYGIQGRAAGFVKALQGSYSNVVGLPLAEVVEWIVQNSLKEQERIK